MSHNFLSYSLAINMMFNFGNELSISVVIICYMGEWRKLNFALVLESLSVTKSTSIKDLILKSVFFKVPNYYLYLTVTNKPLKCCYINILDMVNSWEQHWFVNSHKCILSFLISLFIYYNLNFLVVQVCYKYALSSLWWLSFVVNWIVQAWIL